MAKHLWKPGESGNPAGRPPKPPKKSYVQALSEVLTPEEFKLRVKELLETNSWRAKFAALELIMNYTDGKPVQRTITQDGNAIDEALAKLKEQQQEDEQTEIEQMFSEPVIDSQC